MCHFRVVFTWYLHCTRRSTYAVYYIISNVYRLQLQTAYQQFIKFMKTNIEITLTRVLKPSIWEENISCYIYMYIITDLLQIVVIPTALVNLTPICFCVHCNVLTSTIAGYFILVSKDANIVLKVCLSNLYFLFVMKYSLRICDVLVVLMDGKGEREREGTCGWVRKRIN